MPNFRTYDTTVEQMRSASADLTVAWHDEFERGSSPRLARAYLMARDALDGAIRSLKNAEATERDVNQREKVA